MKAKKVFLYMGMILLSATMISLTSCKKDKVENDDDDATIAQDGATADNTYNDVKSIGDQAYNAKTNMLKSVEATESDTATFMLPPVNNITIVFSGGDSTITVDYGIGVTCGDGRVRKGKIMIKWTGRYREVGTVITHTFDGYYVNDRKVEGTKTVTNNGMKTSADYPNGYMEFTVVVNGTITKADGSIITHTANRTRKWIAGFNTPRWYDDVYAISGTGTVVKSNGNTCTTTIIKDIIKPLINRCIIAGEIKMDKTDKTIEINYGNGDWTSAATWYTTTATVTITNKSNGASRTITIDKRQ